VKFSLTTNINQIDHKEWGLFVSNHPNGNIFQSFEEYQLFTEVEFIKPIIIAVFNEDHKLCAILLALLIKDSKGLKGFFSSRTVIYGGPLIDYSNPDAEIILDLILKRLSFEVKNKSIFIQFRNFFNWGPYIKIFNNNGYQFRDRLNYLVNTESRDELVKKISKSKIRQIKKGLASGAEIIQPENIDEVQEFYNILRHLYRYKVNKPLLDWSFFKSFYNLSVNGNIGKLLLVKYQSKIIGGILCPVFEDKVIYEWYVCGLDETYKNQYPSVLATWAAIDFALKNNIKTFDFMGVGVPEREYGVRDFKSKFGGDMVSYGRFGIVNNKLLYIITEIGYNILALMHKI
jgi:serine/alanine adding enzyme